MKKKELQRRFEFAKRALKAIPDGTWFLLVGDYRRNNKGSLVWEGKILTKLPGTGSFSFDVTDLFRAIAGQRKGSVVSSGIGAVQLFLNVRDSFGKRGKWDVDSPMDLSTEGDLNNLAGMVGALGVGATHEGLSPREPSEPRAALLTSPYNGTY